jgi:hypothetical protein
MIVYGYRRYGKVDELPNGCHVASHFFHIWFVPLVPFKSFIVVGEGGEDSFQGVTIPLSGKSVLAGWLRAAFVFGAIGCIFAAPLGLIGTAACIGLFFWSYRWFRPSPERAAELYAYLGLDPHGEPPRMPAPAPVRAGQNDWMPGVEVVGQARGGATAQAAPAWAQNGYAAIGAQPTNGALPALDDGTLLLAPYVEVEQVRATLEPLGFAPTEPPQPHAARWSNGGAWISWKIDAATGARLLRFDGAEPQAWRSHLAGVLPVAR